jgi:hypothetical protein
MPSRGLQQAIVGAVVGIGFVLAIISSRGRDVGDAWSVALRIYSISATGIGLLLIAHDRWLWRLPILRFGHPTLEGTWRGRLSSTFVAPDGKEFKELVVHLRVSQTFSSVAATLLTERSQSESLGTRLYCGTDGRWHLTWIFLNQPRPRERPASGPHNGACELIVAGARGEVLEGRYFTDRSTQGELVFDCHPTLSGPRRKFVRGARDRVRCPIELEETPSTRPRPTLLRQLGGKDIGCTVEVAAFLRQLHRRGQPPGSSGVTPS